MVRGDDWVKQMIQRKGRSRGSPQGLNQRQGGLQNSKLSFLDTMRNKIGGRAKAQAGTDRGTKLPMPERPSISGGMARRMRGGGGRGQARGQAPSITGRTSLSSAPNSGDPREIQRISQGQSRIVRDVQNQRTAKKVPRRMKGKSIGSSRKPKPPSPLRETRVKIRNQIRSGEEVGSDARSQRIAGRIRKRMKGRADKRKTMKSGRTAIKRIGGSLRGRDIADLSSSTRSKARAVGRVSKGKQRTAKRGSSSSQRRMRGRGRDVSRY